MQRHSETRSVVICSHTDKAYDSADKKVAIELNQKPIVRCVCTIDVKLNNNTIVVLTLFSKATKISMFDRVRFSS